MSRLKLGNINKASTAKPKIYLAPIVSAESAPLLPKLITTKEELDNYYKGMTFAEQYKEALDRGIGIYPLVVTNSAAENNVTSLRINDARCPIPYCHPHKGSEYTRRYRSYTLTGKCTAEGLTLENCVFVPKCSIVSANVLVTDTPEAEITIDTVKKTVHYAWSTAQGGPVDLQMDYVIDMYTSSDYLAPMPSSFSFPHGLVETLGSPLTVAQTFSSPTDGDDVQIECSNDCYCQVVVYGHNSLSGKDELYKGGVDVVNTALGEVTLTFHPGNTSYDSIQLHIQEIPLTVLQSVQSAVSDTSVVITHCKPRLRNVDTYWDNLGNWSLIKPVVHYSSNYQLVVDVASVGSYVKFVICPIGDVSEIDVKQVLNQNLTYNTIIDYSKVDKDIIGKLITSTENPYYVIVNNNINYLLLNGNDLATVGNRVNSASIGAIVDVSCDQTVAQGDQYYLFNIGQYIGDIINDSSADLGTLTCECDILLDFMDWWVLTQLPNYLNDGVTEGFLDLLVADSYKYSFYTMSNAEVAKRLRNMIDNREERAGKYVSQTLTTDAQRLMYWYGGTVGTLSYNDFPLNVATQVTDNRLARSLKAKAVCPGFSAMHSTFVPTPSVDYLFESGWDEYCASYMQGTLYSGDVPLPSDLYPETYTLIASYPRYSNMYLKGCPVQKLMIISEGSVCDATATNIPNILVTHNLDYDQDRLCEYTEGDKVLQLFSKIRGSIGVDTQVKITRTKGALYDVVVSNSTISEIFRCTTDPSLAVDGVILFSDLGNHSELVECDYYRDDLSKVIPDGTWSLNRVNYDVVFTEDDLIDSAKNWADFEEMYPEFILNEPIEGFSQEALDAVRDILQPITSVDNWSTQLVHSTTLNDETSKTRVIKVHGTATTGTMTYTMGYLLAMSILERTFLSNQSRDLLYLDGDSSTDVQVLHYDSYSYYFLNYLDERDIHFLIEFLMIRLSRIVLKNKGKIIGNDRSLEEVQKLIDEAINNEYTDIQCSIKLDGHTAYITIESTSSILRNATYTVEVNLQSVTA